MKQDFAKIRPEPILDKKVVQSPPAWSMMVTGILIGTTLGVFACVLFYLSGNVPPIKIAENPQSNLLDIPSLQIVEKDRALELEFYTELPKYEVRTDSIPVEIVNETIEDPESMTRTNKFMLQTGAFQAQESADRERQRQADLGLNVIVKLTELSGRNLYLVQAGPYASQADLEEAREVLSAHDISTLTIQLQ
jgi:hypothetical protein